MPERICLYGGAFDPLHTGHERIAAASLKTLGANKVIWVPTFDSAFAKAPALSFSNRFSILKHALAHKKEYMVSDIEANLPRPSYTLRTLKALQEHFAPETKWYLLIGSDQFQNFHKWHAYQELLNLASLAVYPRPGFLPVNSKINSFTLIPGPTLSVSSAQLREKLLRGEPIGSEEIPSRVRDFIRQKGFYS